tara:strand:- start:7724 stop:9949 length:2226 start_codon:yes stop_codon:yes gene_type:complete
MAITANKLLGKGESGGALAVRPTTSLVSYKGIDPIEKSESDSSEKTLFNIHKKIILIDDLLKGTIAEKKKRQKDEKKQKEDDQRKKAESKIEDDATDSDDEEENKLKMPRISFLDGIKKFISNVLLGWLTFKLIKYLPTITKFLKPIAAIASFFIKWGGKFLDGLVTFIDWGYKGLDATKGWIGDKFGEGAAEKFESFMGNLTKMFNGIVLLGMGIAKLAMMNRPRAPRGPRRGPRNQLRRTRTRLRRILKPNTKAIERAKRIKEIAKKRKAAEQALKRARMLRKLRPTNIRRVARVVTGKPIRAISNLVQSPAVQNLIKNPGQTIKNLRQSGADKIDDVAKNVGKSKWFGNLKGAGKNLWGKLGQAKNFLGNLGKNFLNWADDFGKKFMANADEIIKGVGAKASNWAKSIGDIAEMAKNPAKLIEKAKSVLGGQLDDVVKQNKTVSKLINLAKNPKEITKGIKGLLNNAKKSKGLLQLRQGLKGAQKMKIGGIDKIIAAIMGLLDYTVFKESPINAILRAIGGLLGYTAGFAIGAPFGGAPGFITGMAGGFVGEKVAMLIAKGLSKTPLGQIQDPIMNDGRMLVRDPDDTGMNEEIAKEQEEYGLGDDKKFDKIDKTFKMGKKEYDLSKLQGGLSREEYNALSNKDRGILDRRLRMYASQNPKGNAENILPLDVNSIKKKTDDVSMSASYEDDSEEIIVVESGSQGDSIPETQPKETLTPIAVGAGGGSDEMGDRLYKGG